MKFILPFGYAVFLMNFFYSLEISEGLGQREFPHIGNPQSWGVAKPSLHPQSLPQTCP